MANDTNLARFVMFASFLPQLSSVLQNLVISSIVNVIPMEFFKSKQENNFLLVIA
jgi:hypothetical protein